MHPMYGLFDKASMTRRAFTFGLAASAATPVMATSHEGESFRKVYAHVKNGRYWVEALQAFTRCVDPRPDKDRVRTSVSARALAGGDVCLITAGYALGNTLGIPTNRMTEAVFAAAFEAVGGAGRFCRHTDEDHFDTNDQKNVKGCLYCRMISDSCESFGLRPQDRDAVFAGLARMPTQSRVYLGTSHPFAILTVKQEGYRPGDVMWGVRGTVDIDGEPHQLYVNNDTLGEVHLTRYACLLRKHLQILESYEEKVVVSKVVKLWRSQTAEIIALKRQHHENIVEAIVTFKPDGSFHNLRLAA